MAGARRPGREPPRRVGRGDGRAGTRALVLITGRADFGQIIQRLDAWLDNEPSANSELVPVPKR
jgi:hypothetical protein